MKRAGILGGTFNPIHIGHLAMAQTALEEFKLDKVIFIPSNLPPHKTMTNLVPARDRFDMVRISIQDNQRFDISDFEITQGGKSYTVNTVRHLQETLPAGTKLFFIIGGDMFPHLPSWHKISEILATVSFIVVQRPGYEKFSGPVKHHSVVMPGIDVSSSDLRRRVRQGKSIRYFVPDQVVDYILKHKFYTPRGQ